MPATLIRSGDRRYTTLTFVHPITGRSDVYVPLANALSWPGNTIGIDARSPRDPELSMRELAAEYASELPDGPVCLFGWGLGGVLAAEMTHTAAAKHEVRFLGLFDSRAPQPEMRSRPTDRTAVIRAFLAQRALVRDRSPGAPPTSTDPAAVLAAVRELDGGPEISDEDVLEQRLQVFGALLRAFFRHEPTPLSVTLHLFEATDEHPAHPKPPSLGWETLAPRIERHPVAGTHYSMLSPIHVSELARLLDTCLQTAK
jgi:thioesterase domain-containing protein